ncbi:HAD family hydrolase [Catellatospora vulcania]|uniref:hypothetical protein n=1 Tax=Catellatospora vulcania TaxID=1460450 RepID=UPI0018AF650A|nr:hypothetical protein [Catellatospora vulcania]
MVELARQRVTKASAPAETAAELNVGAGGLGHELLCSVTCPTMGRCCGGGRSVAVANAHTVVRAVAKKVTLPDVEDGTALYLERLLSAALTRPTSASGCLPSAANAAGRGASGSAAAG